MTVVGGSWWQQRGVVGWIVRWSDSRSYGLFWRRERERFGKRGWAPLSSRQKHKQSLSRGVQGATSSGEDQRPADAWEQSLSVLATHSHHLGGFKDTSSVVSPSEFLINCIGGGVHWVIWSYNSSPGDQKVQPPMKISKEEGANQGHSECREIYIRWFF